MAKKKRRTVYSGIGGQAVLEGVMMKNRGEYATAVRRPDGDIQVNVSTLDYDPKSLIRRIPFVRGIVAFIDSLKLGMNTLSWSAEFYDDEEEEENGKKSLLEKLFGDKAEDVVMGLTVFISIIFAVALFMLLPWGVSELLRKRVSSESLILLTEGGIRIAVFIIYVASIALMKDIRRLYMYHGAEHKCINCVEQGRALTVRNVMRSSRFHKRCGTSFMLFVVLLGVILCFFIRTEILWMRVVIRLALIPVIAGISYELLQLAGKRDSIILSIISAPGLWMQRITTREPDEEMVEVAIASVEAVFDWRAFREKHFERSELAETVDMTAAAAEIEAMEAEENRE
ncbi:MAG: DUF1385 domain-containing protein [Lachnospiraceae bacterium]|nr:DUF1385 domain-containing protein [Lachnospiraceae bacterium]